MRGTALAYVVAVFGEVLRQQPGAVEVDDAFDAREVDSVTNLNLVARMERDLGELPVTLLFEHRTIAAVAGFLADRFPERFADTAGADPDGASGGRPGLPDPAQGVAAGPPVTSYSDDDVAVVGVSGRYPGAADLDELWRLLAAGEDCIEEIPTDRWDWQSHFDPREGQADRSYSRWGGFLPDIDLFDPASFRILPRDAAHIDPQERLFLEIAWELLESAGQLGPGGHEPDTGVFVGSMYRTFGRIGARGWATGRYGGPDAPAWSIANRVSYFFDLHGPSFTVDSACSSSLTAVHLASESLRRGECRAAIAGGVNLILHPAHFVSLCALGMLSRDGRCRVFDADADGFVPGEGVGAVLLKRLRDAVEDGDAVWGVIRGSSVNADGRTAGYTVPNPAAQAALVTRAYRRAGVDPRTVSYVEAHGTGTALGDPIEIAGLRRAFEVPGSGEGTCLVGSIKANIGHLEGAAGIAGLTKVLLQFRHRSIAPCAGLKTVNPRIGFPGSPLRPAVGLTPWARPTVELDGGPFTVPRRAGVSAFGAGGANAHVLLEEYIAQPTATGPHPAGYGPVGQMVLLSARTRSQLAALADRLADRLDQQRGEPASLAGIAYTSQVGRMELPERCAIFAADVADLVDRLRSVAGGVPAEAPVIGAAATGAAPLAGDRLGALARRWVGGESVDWRTWWAGGHPARVAFPPYPFDRVRFPVDIGQPVSAEQAELPGPVQPRPASDEPVDRLFERELRRTAAEFLMIEDAAVDADADLLDLGFDSISLTEFLGRIGDRFGVELPVTLIFDAPTLTDLARRLREDHGAAPAAGDAAATRMRMGD